MDISSVAGAYEGLKAVKSLLTQAFDAKVDAEAKSRISEAQFKLGQVQDDLFALREHLFALLEERNALKRQIEESEGWSARSASYVLTTTVGGAVVYKSVAGPEHFACPSCFNKQEIHLLQPNRNASGKFRCTGCNNDFPIEPRQDPSMVTPLPGGRSWQA